MLVTQSTAGVLALVLGVLVATGLVAAWMRRVIAVLFGCTRVVDKPAKHNLALEMMRDVTASSTPWLSTASSSVWLGYSGQRSPVC